MLGHPFRNCWILPRVLLWSTARFYAGSSPDSCYDGLPDFTWSSPESCYEYDRLSDLDPPPSPAMIDCQIWNPPPPPPSESCYDRLPDFTLDPPPSPVMIDCQIWTPLRVLLMIDCQIWNPPPPPSPAMIDCQILRWILPQGPVMIDCQIWTPSESCYDRLSDLDPPPSPAMIDCQILRWILPQVLLWSTVRFGPPPLRVLLWSTARFYAGSSPKSCYDRLSDLDPPRVLLWSTARFYAGSSPKSCYDRLSDLDPPRVLLWSTARFYSNIIFYIIPYFCSAKGVVVICGIFFKWNSTLCTYPRALSPTCMQIRWQFSKELLHS